MSGARVLVVEHESQVRRRLRLFLAKQGFEVMAAVGGEEGLAVVDHRPPDLILLDLELPGMSGLQVCWSIRRWSCIPIIALSAGSTEQEKVTALELGADDYLTKPFGVDELSARIRVALRRAAGDGIRPEVVLGNGELRVDFRARRVWRGGTEVDLTPREYDVLKYLVQHRDRTLTHAEVVRGVWGSSHECEGRRSRSYLASLRRKLEADPIHPRYISTVRGVGCRFCS